MRLDKEDVMHLWAREPQGNDHQDRLYRFARAVMDASDAKLRVELGKAQSTIDKLNNRIEALERQSVTAEHVALFRQEFHSNPDDLEINRVKRGLLAVFAQVFGG